MAAGRIMIADIIEAVAAEHKVLPENLTMPDISPARKREFAWDLEGGMALARELITTPSCYPGDRRRRPIALPTIARQFGRRDHTTVIHALRAVEKRRRSDPEVHERLRRVTLELLKGMGR